MKSGKLIKKREDQVARTTTDSLNGYEDRLHHRIAMAAYELYKQRGGNDGHDVEDWLKAETLVSAKTQ